MKIKIFKLAVTIFAIWCCGAFSALIIECGIDSILIIATILAVVLAVCAGISTYEEIKDELQK